MSENASRLPSLPLPTLAILVAAIGGYFWFGPPDTNQRPEQPQGVDLGVLGDDAVDARLWEDPLRAVRQHFAAQSARGGARMAPHSIDRLGSRLASAANGGNVLLLPVTVPGGEYAEDAERRRRDRHAVLSALGSRGFGPRSENRIEYLVTHWANWMGSAVPSLEQQLDGRRDGLPDTVPFLVPYERWAPRSQGGEQSYGAVYVFWVDESATGAWTLAMIDQLLAALADKADVRSLLEPGQEKRVDLRLIGPSSSSTLLGILRQDKLGFGTLPVGEQAFSTRELLGKFTLLLRAVVGEMQEQGDLDDKEADALLAKQLVTAEVFTPVAEATQANLGAVLLQIAIRIEDGIDEQLTPLFEDPMERRGVPLLWMMDAVTQSAPEDLVPALTAGWLWAMTGSRLEPEEAPALVDLVAAVRLPDDPFEVELEEEPELLAALEAVLEFLEGHASDGESLDPDDLLSMLEEIGTYSAPELREQYLEIREELGPYGHIEALLTVTDEYLDQGLEADLDWDAAVEEILKRIDYADPLEASDAALARALLGTLTVTQETDSDWPSSVVEEWRFELGAEEWTQQYETNVFAEQRALAVDEAPLEQETELEDPQPATADMSFAESIQSLVALLERIDQRMSDRLDVGAEPAPGRDVDYLLAFLEGLDARIASSLQDRQRLATTPGATGASYVFEELLEAVGVPEHLRSPLPPRTALKTVRPHLRILCPRATAAPALLLGHLSPGPKRDAVLGLVRSGSHSARELLAGLVTAQLSGRRIVTNEDWVASIGAGTLTPRFRSTTVTDELSAFELVRELGRRGLELGDSDGEVGTDQIVLVGEWDTFYGRALPQALRASLDLYRKRGGQVATDPEALGEELDRRLIDLEDADPLRDGVRSYSYLRVLDGVSPGRTSSRMGSEEIAADPTSIEYWQPSVESWEWPVGASQLDYMSRLADALVEWDEVLGEKEQSIRAIGVVGSDVFDKQLVLQTLRRRFPDAIFFTTDIDAQLLHASQYHWSRNLLMSGAFGLEVEGQGRMPPFRDSYQTATYATCVGLLAGEECEPPEAARIFEVGRTGAVDLTELDRRSEDGLGRILRGLTPGPVFWIVVALLAVLLPFSEIPRRAIRSLAGAPASRRATWAQIKLVGITSLALLASAELFVMGGFGDEPLSLLGGVSVWPTVIGRHLVVLLCVFFLVDAHRKLTLLDRKLEGKFGLLPADTLMESVEVRLIERAQRNRKASKGLELPRWALYLQEAYWTGSVMGWLGRESNRTEQRRMQTLWSGYHRRAHWQARWLRVAISVGVFLIFSFFVYGNEEELGIARGSYAQTFEDWSFWVSLTAIVVLTSFLIDTIQLENRFIRLIAEAHTIWPHAARRRYLQKRGLSEPEVDDYADVRLIGERTRVVGNLIYGPFVALFVMMVSRNSYFDNWRWSPRLLALYGLLIACALLCALVLRRATEVARVRALRRMTDYLSSAVRGQEEERSKQLELLIGEVEKERTGAFASFAEQPVARAALIPFGGVGLLAVIDAFANGGV